MEGIFHCNHWKLFLRGLAVHLRAIPCLWTSSCPTQESVSRSSKLQRFGLVYSLRRAQNPLSPICWFIFELPALLLLLLVNGIVLEWIGLWNSRVRNLNCFHSCSAAVEVWFPLITFRKSYFISQTAAESVSAAGWRNRVAAIVWGPEVPSPWFVTLPASSAAARVYRLFELFVF